MRRGVVLLIIGVLAAALAAASASADGTPTTTTTTTTTTGTTTTAAPTYARLSPAYLPAGCVGAGAAAIAEPGRSVFTVGTPASSRGPSAYPASASIVAFDSSTGGGSTCKTASVSLQSISLLGGAVTAASVEATSGRGRVSGLAIEGTATTLGAGEMVAIGNWAQLTLGKRVGRLAAPLVLTLLAPHGSLPAGTVIAVAFAAAPQPVTRTKPKHHSSTSTRQGGAGSIQKDRSGKQSAQLRHSKHHGRLARQPPPDFPATPYPFGADGGLAPAARHNPVVSIAMQYLGVPYQWGGATPSTGFDCSGLVQYVFAQLGVSLVHYAAAQWDYPDSVWVSPHRLQPGDLVFFTGSDGTRKAPGHVGIYVDDGYIIDAPHTGSFVRIDRLSEPRLANEYVGARRIVSRLVVARHLLHVSKPMALDTTIRRGFPQSLEIGPPLGESLGIAAGADTFRPGSRGYWMWTGVGLAGLLLLSVTAGGLVVRRRRTPDAGPSTDSPT